MPSRAIRADDGTFRGTVALGDPLPVRRTAAYEAADRSIDPQNDESPVGTGLYVKTPDARTTGGGAEG